MQTQREREREKLGQGEGMQRERGVSLLAIGGNHRQVGKLEL